MSLEMITSSGIPAWIALQACLGDILSLSLSLASLFQTVPSSSSSWSKLDNFCNHADLVWWIKSFLFCLSASPAVEESLSSICWATNFASPLIPTVTFLVKPILSGLISTWIMLAFFGH